MKRDAAPDLSRLQFHWVTPARWEDLAELFGERGACGGCWCMAWRLPHRKWVAGKGSGNRRALKRLVSGGRRPGVLAYLGGRAIGWCALAPRGEYVHLGRSRVLEPVDDRPVWSISCLFILRSHRRLGIAARLLEAAARMAAARGARIVEGYPVVNRMPKAPDAFLWTGVPSAFIKAGFREVARRSPVRPIMRREE